MFPWLMDLEFGTLPFEKSHCEDVTWRAQIPFEGREKSAPICITV